MCKLCETNPVYEFTNKRKLCKRCFINYFQKKVLYTIRRFKMIKKGDKIFYKRNNDFKGIVLSEILKFISGKIEITLINSKNKADKIAIDSSLDSESENIIKILIKKNISDLKKFLPVYRKVIKPLYLFLDEEILLYARLKNLKFQKKKEKKDKIKNFEDELEKKHPEVKRAIVNTLLKFYK
jgi:tRNA(Ile)-lysidine synthase TilS/MesJ